MKEKSADKIEYVICENEECGWEGTTDECEIRKGKIICPNCAEEIKNC